jgi:hypothetical protein
MTEGHAEGGLIRGPGTGTSDSILGRLSHGEFVMRSAAVSRYGEGFMHAVNAMSLPGFAEGGFVSLGPRFLNSGGTAAGPGSTLNLHIDGHSFKGLHAPQPVADALSKFAISRQLSATGRKPSWVQ